MSILFFIVVSVIFSLEIYHIVPSYMEHEEEQHAVEVFQEISVFRG